MPIQSFSDKDTEDFFNSGHVRKGIGWASVSRIVRRKLDILHYASELKDLKVMPGNRLEILKGNLKGYYSIQINDQWRLIFKWSDSGVNDVSITDYH
ncbi:MAG: type II toxin-antitoxin system RelE/ParE family toxin [Candidatus Humimicrobiaceae bacterium]